MKLTAVNPVNGQILQTYDAMSKAAAADCIQKVEEAYHVWRGMTFHQRAELMMEAAHRLRAEKDDLARLMAVEMGKPLSDGRAEIEKCGWVCEHYAQHAASMLSPETFATDASRSYVHYQPLGVVLAVMPWNYPFWQVFRFAAPALMAGNAAVLKHASNVPGCALAIERIFDDAGFPPHLFQTLLVGSEAVEMLIAHPLIRAVTLTGSTAAGQAVAAAAGRHLKKTVLELGGSDPYIILEDADLAEAVDACVASRLLNSGQSCIAAKRFIVVPAVRDAFENMLVGRMAAQKMGDPLEDDVAVGPQARLDLREDLHRQVEESVSQGAQCLLGGKLPDGPGAFYPPTVLTDVRKGMPAFDEEVFGPVAAVVPVKDDVAAIRMANDTAFGLGAAVFTRDVSRGERIAAEDLQAGNCFVNDFVKSDPRLPFGGIKQSGYGRELSYFGIREFVNIKTVYIK